MVNPEQRAAIELFAKDVLGFGKVVFDSEYYDKNQAGCAGLEYLAFGEYEDFDLMTSSLFHEYAHCICPWVFKKDYMVQAQLEIECWRIAFEEMNKRGLSVTIRHFIHAMKSVSTHTEFEIREFTPEGLLSFQKELRQFNKEKYTEE